MNILILSDLHYIKDHKPSTSKRNALKRLAKKSEFDLVLLCGDNAELVKDYINHIELFEFLRDTFDCQIGFILGNHDLWGKEFGISSYDLLYDVFPEISYKLGLTYLETTNIIKDDWNIVGTYGHYDYSLANKGKIVTQKAIENMFIVIDDKRLGWNDKRCMYWGGKKDKEVCNELVSNLEERINDQDGKLILITHGVPTYKLIGYPRSLKNDFLAAYSGSKRFAELCEKYPFEYYFFGHTHAHIEGKIGKAKAINIGSDYDNLSYYVLETNSDKYFGFHVNFI